MERLFLPAAWNRLDNNQNKDKLKGSCLDIMTKLIQCWEVRISLVWVLGLPQWNDFIFLYLIHNHKILIYQTLCVIFFLFCDLQFRRSKCLTMIKWQSELSVVPSFCVISFWQTSPSNPSGQLSSMKIISAIYYCWLYKRQHKKLVENEQWWWIFCFSVITFHRVFTLKQLKINKLHWITMETKQINLNKYIFQKMRNILFSWGSRQSNQTVLVSYKFYFEVICH